MAKKKSSGSRSGKSGRSSPAARAGRAGSQDARKKSAYDSPSLKSLRRLARDVKEEVRSDLNRRVRTAPPIPRDSDMDADTDMPVRSPRDDVRDYLDRMAPPARDKFRKPMP